MFPAFRPVLALVPLLVLFVGCSGSSARASSVPLNVAAITGIRTYHLHAVEIHHVLNGSTERITTDEDHDGPDRMRLTTVTKWHGKTITSELVVVGDRQWTRTGGTWTEQRAMDAGSQGPLYGESLQFCTAFAGLPATDERLNGNRAVHYRAGAAATAAFAGDYRPATPSAWPTPLAFLTTSSVALRVQAADLWTSSDGARPLRATAKYTVTMYVAQWGNQGETTPVDLQVDYSDLDGDIDIEPPS